MSVVEAAYSGPWPLVEMGRVMKRVSEEGYPDLEPLSVFLEAGVVPRSSRSDNHNQLGADLSKYQRVLPGDLVFNKLRTWQGGFGASRHEGIVSPAYIILRPAADGVDTRFVDCVLHSTGHLAELTRVSKFMPPSQFDIIWEDLRAVQIPLPPLEVQRRIADFLDDQAARIDHIITARRQQIGLFSARWSVLLDETVESLGVAHGWVPLRRFVRSIEQGWSPQCDSTPALDHEWGVLKVGAVKRGAFRAWENKRLPEDLSPITEYVLRPGDLLITRANTPALVGDAAVVPEGVPSRLLLCDKIMRVELTPEVNVNFIALAAQTSRARQHFSSLSSGTSQSMVNIRGEDVRDLQVPAAPLSAQVGAAEQVAEERLRTQAIESGANDSIALLQELKRSLISAAVSGEFDVSSADGSRVVV